MKLSDEELLAGLKARAEAELERLIAEKKSAKEISLDEIEALAHQAGDAIKAEITAGLVAQASEEAKPEGGVKCKGCGVKMRNKGKKPKYVKTTSGDVVVQRGYYYCETCRIGVFPPGSAVAAGQEPV